MPSRPDARDNYRVLVGFLGRLSARRPWSPATWRFLGGGSPYRPFFIDQPRADHRAQHSRWLRRCARAARRRALLSRAKASTDDGAVMLADLETVECTPRAAASATWAVIVESQATVATVNLEVLDTEKRRRPTDRAIYATIS